MRDHLYNNGSYKKLKENPISKISRMVKKAIKDSNLNERINKRLSLDSEIVPRIYKALKIHKAGAPLRPIVKTIGAPIYELANYVASKLAPLVGKTNSYIKDHNHYIELMKKEKLDPRNKIGSFDVIQLFMKIPLDEVVKVVKEVTDPQIAKLVEICFCSTFFTFQGELFEQTSGVAIRSPLSPILANLFMDNF